MSILVVDDDYGIRDFLTQALEDEGYEVTGAANGVEALTYLRTQNDQPCIILLDLMMPEMNGWQFRQEQCADPTLAPIPVIVLSARVDIVEQVQSLAVNEHLSKPIDLDRLLGMVHRYCPGDESAS